MDFKNWLFSEALSADSLKKYHPLHGEWQPPLNSDTGQWIFKFDVPGEQVCRRGYCYSVYVLEDSADGMTGADIDFERDGVITQDTDLYHANAVLRSVMAAMKEFIQVKKPEYLTWNASPERQRVYESMMLRTIYPHLYVPVQEDFWVRRDIYESRFMRQRNFPNPPSPSIGLKATRQSYNQFIDNPKLYSYTPRDFVPVNYRPAG